MKKPGVDAAGYRFWHAVPRDRLACPHPYLEHSGLISHEETHRFAAQPPLLRKITNGVVRLERGIDLYGLRFLSSNCGPHLLLRVLYGFVMTPGAHRHARFVLPTVFFSGSFRCLMEVRIYLAPPYSRRAEFRLDHCAELEQEFCFPM